MKWVTFDEVGNSRYYGRDPYQIDFDTNEHRKYKVVMDGVRVYECGIIRVEKSGIRDPGWRKEVRRIMGLSFLLSKEMTGYKFFDPNNGRKVSKSSLPVTPMYHDDLRGRVHAIGYRTINKYMEFVSEHAQPSFMGTGTLEYWRPNKERAKARMKELEEFINLGAAFNSLEGSHKSLSWTTGNMVRDGKVPTGGVTNPDFKDTCRELAAAVGAVEKLVKVATRDVFKPRFLIAKEA